MLNRYEYNYNKCALVPIFWKTRRKLIQIVSLLLEQSQAGVPWLLEEAVQQWSGLQLVSCSSPVKGAFTQKLLFRSNRYSYSRRRICSVCSTVQYRQIHTWPTRGTFPLGALPSAIFFPLRTRETENQTTDGSELQPQSFSPTCKGLSLNKRVV